MNDTFLHLRLPILPFVICSNNAKTSLYIQDQEIQQYFWYVTNSLSCFFFFWNSVSTMPYNTGMEGVFSFKSLASESFMKYSSETMSGLLTGPIRCKIVYSTSFTSLNYKKMNAYIYLKWCLRWIKSKRHTQYWWIFILSAFGILCVLGVMS